MSDKKTSQMAHEKNGTIRKERSNLEQNSVYKSITYLSNEEKREELLSLIEKRQSQLEHASSEASAWNKGKYKNPCEKK